LDVDGWVLGVPTIPVGIPNSIPFPFKAAKILIMGYNLSILNIMGVIALAGTVPAMPETTDSTSDA